MEVGVTSQEMQDPLKPGKGKKQSLPKSLQKEHSLDDTFILAQ